MNDGNANILSARFYFKALFAVGIVLLGIGLLIVPVSPQFQLDAVLSETELADPKTKQATLELLTRANGNQWLVWSVAGVLVSSLSAMGLWNCRNMSNAQSA